MDNSSIVNAVKGSILSGVVREMIFNIDISAAKIRVRARSAIKLIARDIDAAGRNVNFLGEEYIQLWVG